MIWMCFKPLAPSERSLVSQDQTTENTFLTNQLPSNLKRKHRKMSACVFVYVCEDEQYTLVMYQNTDFGPLLYQTASSKNQINS